MLYFDMKYKALLFDVDGVLVETEKSRFNYFQKELKKIDIELADSFFYQIIGKSTPVFFHTLVQNQHCSKEVADQLITEYYQSFKNKYIENAIPISATVDYISKYSGQSVLGIATTNTRTITLELLKHLHLDTMISGVVTRDDIKEQKPHPEAYLKLADLLQTQPNECAVIEDTITGAQAGIAAGMDCYIYLNSYNNKEQFVDVKIKGFITTSDDLEAISL